MGIRSVNAALAAASGVCLLAANALEYQGNPVLLVKFSAIGLGLANAAALRCTAEDVGERRRALSAAKALIGQSSRFVGQQSVQLHGGMGMTDELKVSHWFKRLTAAQLMFGDSDTHLQRYAALTRA